MSWRDGPRRQVVQPAGLRTKCRASSATSSRRARSGGSVDADHVEPVEEVFAEGAFLDELPKVGVGRRNDAGVELDRLRFADALDLALLQRAQQLGLQRQRHQADFVDEERAAVREFEPADAVGDGAGERAARVAEQLGLGQTFGNGGRVERDERLVARG